MSIIAICSQAHWFPASEVGYLLPSEHAGLKTSFPAWWKQMCNRGKKDINLLTARTVVIRWDWQIRLHGNQTGPVPTDQKLGFSQCPLWSSGRQKEGGCPAPRVSLPLHRLVCAASAQCLSLVPLLPVNGTGCAEHCKLKFQRGCFPHCVN